MKQHAPSKAASLREIVAPSIDALRAYWPAIACIQLFALGLVLSYYRFDFVQDSFAIIEQWKQHGGLWFAGISTVFSGGIIPEAIKRLFRRANTPHPQAGELAHQFVMWALLGILVERFYFLQGLIFGDGTDPITLLLKVLCDQLIFTPFASLPFIILWTKLRETRYHLSTYFKSISLRELKARVPPIWATCLVFWPTMLFIIYSLPQLLQFPLFLLGNTAFSILMIFILRRQTTQWGSQTDE